MHMTTSVTLPHSPIENDGQAIALPKGDRRPVTIVALNLRIPPDMDEETIFNIQSLHLQVATTIAEEYHGQIIRQVQWS